MGARVRKGVKEGLGSRIRASRMAIDMTQEQLSWETGVSQVTISNLERGVTAGVSSDRLAALSAALGVSTDYLLGRTKT